MITEPGIFDISEAEYHKDPCENPSGSCSILQMIDDRSPLHAMFNHPRFRMQEETNERKFDFGSAFHKLMTGRGRDIAAIDVADWRTKDAKMLRDRAYQEGKIPMKLADFQRVQDMVQEVNLQLGTHPDWPGLYEYEKTMIWKEDENFFRIRPDRMDPKQDIMWDFKATETSAAPETFQRHIFSMNYDFRAAFYARGYEALMKRPLKEYRFIACEVQAPHALTMFAMTPEALAFAGKRVDRAVELWKTCCNSNQWPGYPAKMVYVNPPKWRENLQIEREILEGEE